MFRRSGSFYIYIIKVEIKFGFFVIFFKWVCRIVGVILDFGKGCEFTLHCLLYAKF